MDKELMEKIEELTRSARLLQKKFQEVQPDLSQRIEAVREAMQPYGDVIARINEVTEQLRNAYTPILERLGEIAPTFRTGLGNLSEDQAKKISLLAQNGWFPDFCAVSVGRVFELNNQYHETYFTRGQECADHLLADHFEGVMNLFTEKAGTDFPQNRLLIIQDAISAHSEGKYNLSTPIFLMQADGYSAEAHNSPIWGAGKKEQRLFARARTENDEDTLIGALVEPLLSPSLPLLAHHNIRASENYPVHIVNRHAVLHGESTDYGTRENSARAFSFMWYCMFFMHNLFAEEEA
ncbi:hypothetical protein [Halomonas salina]|uniref:hypothetical protein n=1 Tax=Halomonas salina TaxID=42565 RepID=UPI001267DF53|nr:hypothetical protein [Halomonas salina]